MDDAKMKEKVEEMKSKAKAFMKNFSSPFGSARTGSGSSSQTFRGQGHRLGGSAEPSIGSSASSGATSSGGGCHMARRLGPGCHEQKQQQSDLRKLQQEKWERERGMAPAQPSCHLHESNSAHARRTQTHVLQSGGSLSSAAASVKSPTPDDSLRVERESRGTVQVGNLAPSYSTWNDSPSHFDPYSPIIASGTSHRPAVAVNRVPEPQGKFQCPICQTWWQSEAQVSSHIDDCTGVRQPELTGLSIREGGSGGGNYHRREHEGDVTEDLDEAVAIFLSGGPSKATLEVILRVFRNILSAPTDEKYRKLRLGNPKIQETIGSAIGGLKFLESVGFRPVVEGREYFSLMQQPSIEQQERVQAAIVYLDSYYSTKTAPVSSTQTSHLTSITPTNFNRQLRIFYASKDHLEERFEVPDSFYKVSSTEVKNEAAARRKKLEDSQLLIPKSFKEKQAAIARRRFKATVVRVQLPDGLVVQGFFKPGEPTSALYEFVASILKDSHEPFDLVLPAATRHRVIPRAPQTSGQCLTFEEADLVPKALLKFNPTGPQGYTCLKSECYDLCEPLTLTSLLEPGDFSKR